MRIKQDGLFTAWGKIGPSGGYLRAGVKRKHMFGLTWEANVKEIEGLGKVQTDSSAIQPIADQPDINNWHAMLLMPHQILLSTVAIKRKIEAIWATYTLYKIL